MKFPLDQIETRLQNLIEGSLTALLPGSGRKKQLAAELIRALGEGVRIENGIPTVPGNYLMFTSPSQMTFWQTHPFELESLSRLLGDAGREAGYQFTSEPRLILAEDPGLAPSQVRVIHQSLEETGETAVMEVSSNEPAPEEIPANAFLIINGIRVMPLRQTVLNIGRREGNQIIADDPRVSRTHAQLRAVHGVYYIFDLNSTGGTFVNGEPILRTALKAGDVISLAGFPLIYGQEGNPEPPAAPSGGGSMEPGSTDPFTTRKAGDS